MKTKKDEKPKDVLDIVKEMAKNVGPKKIGFCNDPILDMMSKRKSKSV